MKKDAQYERFVFYFLSAVMVKSVKTSLSLIKLVLLGFYF